MSQDTLSTIKTLLLSMQEREYHVTQLKLILGVCGTAVILMSGQKIKNWISSTTSEATKQSMDDPEFKAKIANFSTTIAQEVANNLIDNAEFKERVKTYTKEIIHDSVIEVMEEEDFRNKSKKLVGDIIVSQELFNKTKESTLLLLHNNEVQQEIGNSIRNSLISGFTPTFLRPLLGFDYIENNEVLKLKEDDDVLIENTI